MTQTKTPRFKIVVGFDFSEQAGSALERAVAAALAQPEVDLHVLGVIDGSKGLGSVKPGHHADYRAAEELQTEIAAVVSKLIPKPTPNHLRLYVHTRLGHPAGELLTLASEAGADEIYVGTHGRGGVKRLLLGSVAETVVRKAGCPVIVVRPKSYLDETEQPGEADAGIEPPCPRCVEARDASDGKQWWCDEHSRKRPRPHRYSYASDIVEIRHGDNVLW
jgi:nucleotide-binding universal stress UspA family protein